MLKNFIQSRAFLTNRITQTFAKFERQKPHINVGTIGHIDHGKTTLTSAITKYLAAQQKAKYIAYDKIDKAPQQKQRGITINTATLQYQTEKRHYAHVDCPGHIDYVKNMITGAAKMDAGILVVAATDGPMPQTKEHVLLCRQIGVNQIIVFLNKMDMIKDTEMVDLIEDQLKQLLKKHEYDPEKTAFIRGSAISSIQDINPQLGEQKIKALLDAMDDLIPVSSRPIDKPFMMPIESTYNIAGRGAVASGTIEQGKIKVGEQVEFYGYGCKLKSQVVGVETFNKTLDYGEAGDNVGILVRGLTREQMHRGLVMAEPRSMTTSSVLEANIYVLSEQEGGRKNSFSSGYRPQLYFKTADTAAEIFLPENVKIAKPGDNLKVRAKLHFPLTITKGTRFALREGGKTVAAGVVTEILPEETVLDSGRHKKGKENIQQPAGTPATDAAKKPADTKAGDKKAGDKKPGDSKSAPKDAAKDGAKKDAPKAQSAGKDAPKTQSPPKPAGTTAAGTGSKVPPPPPAAGKGKVPPPPAGKTPPPPPAGKTTPPPPAGKTPPPPPAGKTPPPPPAGKTPPPPPAPKKK